MLIYKFSKINQWFILPVLSLFFLSLTADLSQAKGKRQRGHKARSRSMTGAVQGGASGADVTMGTAVLKQSILSKMEYDKIYFERVIKLSKQGKSIGKLSRSDFREEVRRAKTNLPILRKFLTETVRYKGGQPFSLPSMTSTYRVYSNLIAMLNMVQALERKDYRTVLRFGQSVSINAKENLGKVRGEGADYYVKLYREFFYLMGAANYRVGSDKKALGWFARLEADTDLAALKSKIESEQTVSSDSKEAKINMLRTRPIAILPFSDIIYGAKKRTGKRAGQGAKEGMAERKDSDWMRTGLMEIVLSDLVQHTDLYVVERSQLDKVLEEKTLAQQGVVLGKELVEMGALLGAGTLLSGTFEKQGEKVSLRLHLVAADDATVIATSSATTTLPTLVDGLRLAVVKLFVGIDWMDAGREAQIREAHAPKTATVRKLMEARLMLASKSNSKEAKKKYAEAMKEDPTYATLFNDLQAEFSDVSAAVGIVPFLNITARPEDEWMVRGTTEALSADLPKFGFTLVERKQLVKLIEQEVQNQMMGTDDAQALGKKVGADFLIMGSIMHMKPRIRIDLRFVEMRTGIVVFSTSAEDDTDDFMAALVTLSATVGERFGKGLGDELLASLEATKMNAEEFKSFVRNQIAKDVIDKEREIKEEEAAQALLPPVLKPWQAQSHLTKVAVGVGAASALLSTAFIVWANSYSVKAQQAVDLRNAATTASERDHYDSEANGIILTGNVVRTVGFVGVLSAIVAGGYAYYNTGKVDTMLLKEVTVANSAELSQLQPPLQPQAESQVREKAKTLFATIAKLPQLDFSVDAVHLSWDF